MNRRLVSVVLGCCLFLSWAQAAPPPRLVVVLVIDQFRPDYLSRASRWLLPAREGNRVGGFRLLMDEGAAYWNASYSYLATFTCAGHAAILSGADPAVSGIISNTWYDREAGRVVGCVDDLKSEDPMVRRSPRSMLVTTVGDELKFSNQGKSKVISLAGKDYAAMAMAGRRADLALWLDSRSGEWISNPYYTGESGLPEWVRDLNAEKIPDSHAGKEWTPLLPAEAYADTDTTPYFADTVDPDIGVSSNLGPWGYGWRFPHLLGAGQKPGPLFYASFHASGFANQFMVESAKRAIEGEKLGNDAAPDILALSFSANDKVGHAFGPDSPETFDMIVRTDRALAELFNYLKEKGSLDQTLLVLTADHGVQNVPEELTAEKSRAGRVPAEKLSEAVQAALNQRFGEAPWVLRVTDLDVYLTPFAMEEKSLDPAQVEAEAARALTRLEGVHWAVTRTDILSGRLPGTDWAERIGRNYHPRRSGDVVILFEPNYFRGETIVTTHGTPYPANARVPLLLFGRGVSGGTFYRPVDPKDIAPTLSLLLGIAYPSGSSGQPLAEALAGFRP